MPAANGRCQHSLCAIIGVLALAAAPAVDAQSAPRRTSAPTAGHPPVKVWTGAQDVAIYAFGMIGVDYRFGGNTPDSGLDCSGLVGHVFREVTGVTLPRTAKEMSTLGSNVKIRELTPGDLVFFNTRRFAFSHVGIYLGDQRFIHAPARGGEVQIATMSQSYWQQRFDGARRLVGVLPSLMPRIVAPAFGASLADGSPAGFISVDYAEATP